MKRQRKPSAEIKRQRKREVAVESEAVITKCAASSL